MVGPRLIAALNLALVFNQESVKRGAGSTEKTREKKEKQKLWIKTFMGKIPSQHKQNKKTTTKKQKSKKKNNKRNHN